VIGDDCWIGGSVIILAGVHIAHGSVIGAGSLVTKDIPAGSVAVGVPARVVRSRYGNEDDPTSGRAQDTAD
jgi:maltose O-acetyltransferase